MLSQENCRIIQRNFELSWRLLFAAPSVRKREVKRVLFKCAHEVAKIVDKPELINFCCPPGYGKKSLSSFNERKWFSIFYRYFKELVQQKLVVLPPNFQ